MRKPAVAVVVITTALCLAAISYAAAAEQTWTGQISDSLCGVSHKAMAEQGGFTDAECTKACVESGAKYVLVVQQSVMKITNQDFAGLKDHAGETVTLTGELKGDSIVVAKIDKK